MAIITIEEANILFLIEQHAKSGASREDLQPFIDRIKRKRVKALAEKRITAVNTAIAAQNTAKAMQAVQKAIRSPKVHKTRQRKLRTQPLRVQRRRRSVRAAINNIFEQEYSKLAKEYRYRTGKHFKRNGQEMHQKMTKLQAIKYRIELMNKCKMAVQEALRKNDPEFHLGGAL